MMQTIIEKDVLLSSMENDVAFLKTVIGIFLADYPAMLSEIRAGLAVNDPTQIMNASHALRGSVSVFGAKEAVEASKILESIARENKLENAHEAVCMLEREMALVASALAEIVKEMG